MTATQVSRQLAPWLRILAVARRHAYVLYRSPHRLFDVTVWPIVDTLLFGSLGVYFVSQGGPGSPAQAGVAYLLSGIVLWHVVYQAQIAVSTGFMEETWSRNLLSLMVTPLRELELVAGIALFGLAKLVMGVGVVADGPPLEVAARFGRDGLEEVFLHLASERQASEHTEGLRP